MNRKRMTLVLMIALVAIAGLAGVLSAVEKGEFYLMSDRTTLTQRAGVPCVTGQNNYCDVNHMCKKGDIARGILLNMDDRDGNMIPTGFGVICANPNELYKNYEVGAYGPDFGGKVYRDPCDVGFILAGAKFYTTDRKTISGVQAVCRRYWPVEEREGINTFGQGVENTPSVCGPGKFVTGIKTSYWREPEATDGKTAGLYGLRFYCAEMREYLGVPAKKEDPRSKIKKKKIN